jgi:hypothetical protein
MLPPNPQGPEPCRIEESTVVGHKEKLRLGYGDVLLFAGSDWHGNGPHDVEGIGERLSVVCYYRRKMLRCGTVEEELRKASR